MDAGDPSLAVEVGESSRDTKRAVIAPCAQAERVGGLVEKRASGLIWSSDIFEQASVAIGIGARARMLQRGEALGLDRPRSGDAGANLGASFRRRRQHEVRG